MKDDREYDKIVVERLRATTVRVTSRSNDFQERIACVEIMVKKIGPELFC